MFAPLTFFRNEFELLLEVRPIDVNEMRREVMYTLSKNAVLLQYLLHSKLRIRPPQNEPLALTGTLKVDISMQLIAPCAFNGFTK